MPRLTPRLVRHAASIDKYLPLLLRECRDLPSAQNELRWLKEHVNAFLKDFDKTDQAPNICTSSSKHGTNALLGSLVRRRARGEPLQYILGSQPFGNLDILSRSKVLIPRLETESYVLDLAKLLLKLHRSSAHIVKPKLNIADVCTGTGCIALLLFYELQKHFDVVVTGYDISEHALRLAGENLVHNIHSEALHVSALERVSFKELNILLQASRSTDDLRHNFSAPVDIIVSNPPYISPLHYKPGGTTSSSVRKFEPKLALVPPSMIVFPEAERADQFYSALLRIAHATSAKVLVMEVGESEQALRVAKLCRAYLLREGVHNVSRVEVWKDDTSVIVDDDSVDALETQLAASGVDARAVVLWLDQSWVTWRKQYQSSP